MSGTNGLPFVEREAVRTLVVGGISEGQFEERLQQLNGDLTSKIYAMGSTNANAIA